MAGPYLSRFRILWHAEAGPPILVPGAVHRSFWRGPGKLVTSAQATLKFILAIVR